MKHLNIGLLLCTAPFSTINATDSCTEISKKPTFQVRVKHEELAIKRLAESKGLLKALQTKMASPGMVTQREIDETFAAFVQRLTELKNATFIPTHHVTLDAIIENVHTLEHAIPTLTTKEFRTQLEHIITRVELLIARIRKTTTSAFAAHTTMHKGEN